MKRAPRSRQRHDLYAKYHDYDSEISDLLGECGFKSIGLIDGRILMPAIKIVYGRKHRLLAACYEQIAGQDDGRPISDTTGSVLCRDR